MGKNTNDELNSLNRESFILENFRLIPSSRIKYVGRFLPCFRVERLIKSILFSKSWTDSSSKRDMPPDFHNDKHHIMMEMMRVDDGVGSKHSPNSFTRTNDLLNKYFDSDYKNKLAQCSAYVIPDTRDDKKFNFKGYFQTFKRVLTNHSEKVDNYRDNYPKCKTCVLFICDESNAYYQNVDNGESKILHLCFNDKKFVEIIEHCKADYVVWFTLNKTVLRENEKEIKQPLACIYDVKHTKQIGFDYNHDKMIKIK